MNVRRVITSLIGTAVLSTLTGCARFPGTAPTSGKQLVITLKVRGKINPIDSIDPNVRRHYFVAIDNDGDPNTGPWAAVYPPYGGNGWVTSANPIGSIGLTSYLEYDAENPTGYIYGILPGNYFLITTSPIEPIQSDLTDGGSTLRFVIDFSQIATKAIPADQIRYLEINFITTNKLTTSVTPVAGREWDGLGPSGQNYVPVDVTSEQPYYGDNSDGPTITDPDLEIVYWSIEIQTFSSR